MEEKKEFPVCIEISIVIVFLLINFSCKNSTPISAKFHHNIYNAEVCTLSVIDTIGIEFGDSNYVFGSVMDVCIDSRNNVFVMDGMQHSILRFDEHGSFVNRIGRSGSAPGEFNQPACFTVLDNGFICAYDHINGYIYYDSAGVCINSILVPDIGAHGVLSIAPFDSTCVIGEVFENDRFDNSHLRTTSRVCKWNPQNIDPIEQEYFQAQYFLNLHDLNEGRCDAIKMEYFRMLFSFGSDFICVAPDPVFEPLLLIFDENGLLMDTLFLPYPSLSKSDSEIESEILFFSALYLNKTIPPRSVDWQPFENKSMIIGLGVDGLNRIWVQRGFESYPTFDLFSFSGEHLMTVILPEREDLNFCNFQISKYGILATPLDPLDYYSVYIFALQ